MMERMYQVQVQFASGEVSPELMASMAEAATKIFTGEAQLNVSVTYNVS